MCKGWWCGGAALAAEVKKARLSSGGMQVGEPDIKEVIML